MHRHQACLKHKLFCKHKTNTTTKKVEQRRTLESTVTEVRLSSSRQEFLCLCLNSHDRYVIVKKKNLNLSKR